MKKFAFHTEICHSQHFAWNTANYFYSSLTYSFSCFTFTHEYSSWHFPRKFENSPSTSNYKLAALFFLLTSPFCQSLPCFQKDKYSDFFDLSCMLVSRPSVIFVKIVGSYFVMWSAGWILPALHYIDHFSRSTAIIADNQEINICVFLFDFVFNLLENLICL